MSSPGLTSADKKALRDIAENGPWKYAKHAGGRTATDVLDNDTRPPDVSYRGGDGRRGITLEMCNAIREAARDRYTYREIRDLFGFVGHEKTAHVHATGRCVHGHGDIPPVPPARDPGPPEGSVTKTECHRLRAGWADGEYASYKAAAESIGRSVSAAWRHINRECSHP